MISVERSFFDKFPRLAHGRARTFSQPVVELLRAIIGEERINSVLTALAPAEGFAFVERALDLLNVRYRITAADREHVPHEGRVVIVANHPLGAIDALVLLHLVGSIRRDVRILANDVLAQIAPLSSLLLPTNVFGVGEASTGRLRDAYRLLEDDHALIIFPAGEVSRIAPNGVRDCSWSSGFVRMARHTAAPILPVHIAAHNSSTFYGLSMVSKPLSTLMLPREMLNANRHRPTIDIGQLVPPAELASAPAQALAQSMRRHVYRIGQRRSGVFTTVPALAHPESARVLRDALRRSETLVALGDGKRIVLADVEPDCPLLHEIGRLRELSFRRVGEGTGTRRDIDRFDLHYRHLILWDEQALAIAGAYRVGEVPQTGLAVDTSRLYSSTLFDYAPLADPFLRQGVELGRSFIQPAYWNSRALDQLWQGLGAYLHTRPHLRYLFGPVSMSAALPLQARQWIARYCLHYFAADEQLAKARMPFAIGHDAMVGTDNVWSGQDAKAGMFLLKKRLAELGCTLPVLYKWYLELCEPDGVHFLAFSTDPKFANCVDGLIRLDLTRIRASKRERYLTSG